MAINGPFHLLDKSFAEIKDWDQTALVRSQSGVEINQSPQRKLTSHSRLMLSLTSSLINPYFFSRREKLYPSEICVCGNGRQQRCP